MDQILDENGLHCNLLCYRVLPTSTSKGFVEFVQGASTLQAIKEPITWIDSQTENHNRGVSELRSVFRRSLAGWSIVTLLLGVGDRHEANVMITRDGRIFHIDYGWVLGRDPKFGMPLMRLTAKELLAAGGEHNAEFRTLCLEVYLCLRRHERLFSHLLLHLADSSGEFSRSELQRELNFRFLTGHSQETATKTLLEWISRSTKSIGLQTNDYARQAYHGIHEQASVSLLNLNTAASNAASWLLGNVVGRNAPVQTNVDEAYDTWVPVVSVELGLDASPSSDLSSDCAPLGLLALGDRSLSESTSWS